MSRRIGDTWQIGPFAGFVFSIARPKGLKPEDADDIVQVVFADFARNLPAFRYDNLYQIRRIRQYVSMLTASVRQREPR